MIKMSFKLNGRTIPANRIAAELTNKVKRSRHGDGDQADSIDPLPHTPSNSMSHSKRQRAVSR